MTTSFQWDYRQRYYDLPGHFRTLSPGFNAGIHLQKGVAFPTGYRIANGQKGGGYPPQGSLAAGNEPIKMQPQTAGNGPLKFITLAKITVTNNTETDGSCAFGLGVADVNGPSFPMWPYIGVAHDLDINQLEPITIERASRIVMTCNRLDLMDNAFMGGQPIPTWPDWEMLPNEKNLLWPAVTPLFKNTGSVPLVVGGVFIFSFTCP